MNEKRSKKFSEYMQFLSDIKDNGGNYQVNEGSNNDDLKTIFVPSEYLK